MNPPDRGATRIARAAAFGVATLTLATGAHVSAGGAVPSLMVLAGLALPLAMAALILTSRRCGLLLLLSSLAAAQLLLHEALMTLSSQGPGEMLAGAVGAPHSVHALLSSPMPAHSGAMMGFAMRDVPMAAGGWSVTMMAVHAVATLVTALLLARGEDAMWHLVARLMPALPCLARLLSCGPRQAPVLLSVPALRPRLVSGGSGLRGPPAAFPVTA
jgi:hypothetical protein